MNVMSTRPLLLLAIAALGLVSPAPIQAWQSEDPALKRIPVPSGLRLVAATASADFDQDGIAETLTLEEGRAIIQSGSQARWQSPQAWQVKQADITDLNQDGLPEAALLLIDPGKSRILAPDQRDAERILQYFK